MCLMWWLSCLVRWLMKVVMIFGLRLCWLNCGLVRWFVWLVMSCYRFVVVVDMRLLNFLLCVVSGWY